MATFRFSRIDASSPVVTWSLVAICVALLSLLIVDARLVAQYLVTMLVSVLTAVVAIIGLGKLRPPAVAKKKARD
jgi:hypothetical protein